MLFNSLTSLLLGPLLGVDTYVVDTTADTPDLNPGDGICADANGMCSLRAAVQEANASGGGIVQLQMGSTYVIGLAGAGEDLAATGDLDVTSSIVIEGGGAVVDAAGLDRAFDVQLDGTLEAKGLTVQGGFATGESGGAFRSTGELRLTRVVVRDSSVTGTGASGGGLFNDGGTLFVVNSMVIGNDASRAGGGIESNGGSTFLSGSTLASNSTGPEPGNGGGFHLTGEGFVEVRSCRVLSNTAASEGGGLWNSSSGTMTVEKVVFNGNVANGTGVDNGGGGLFNAGGACSVADSTFRLNRADQGSGSGGAIFNDGGDFSASWCRVLDNLSNRAGGGIEIVAGTTELFDCEFSRNATGAVPGNGGALHLTGAGEVFVELCDVRENMAAAEGGGLWNSSSGELTVSNCQIEANSAAGDAADQGGGGLFNDGGSLIVFNSTLRDNLATGAAGSGGGILNDGGMLIANNARLVGNDAPRAGGGIESNGGTTDLNATTLEGNSCGPVPGNGGGFHLTGSGVVDADDCVVFGNVAAAEGGGLWNSSGGLMTVTNCVVDDNEALGDEADQGGGGLFNAGGTLRVFGGQLHANRATGASGSGGGALNDLGTLEMTSVTVTANTAVRAGGGVEANVGTTTLLRTRLDGNSTGAAPGNGGGLHLTGPGAVAVERCAVTRNFAENEGGGLWNSSSGQMTVTLSRITDNESPDGPNLFNDGGSLVVDGGPIPSAN